MPNYVNGSKTESFNITHFILRFVVGTVVLAITAALTPGFAISGFWPLIFGSLVLAILDTVVLRMLGANAAPFGKGISGFVLAAIIIYITQFFVAGYSVTLWGALLGALVYGLVDMVIPGKAL